MRGALAVAATSPRSKRSLAVIYCMITLNTCKVRIECWFENKPICIELAGSEGADRRLALPLALHSFLIMRWGRGVLSAILIWTRLLALNSSHSFGCNWGSGRVTSTFTVRLSFLFHVLDFWP